MPADGEGTALPLLLQAKLAELAKRTTCRGMMNEADWTTTNGEARAAS